jgi:hypothetical protein
MHSFHLFHFMYCWHLPCFSIGGGISARFCTQQTLGRVRIPMLQPWYSTHRVSVLIERCYDTTVSIRPLASAGHISNNSWGWSYICKFAILVDWKIQLNVHIAKAIWAKKNDRFMLCNMDIWLETVGTISNFAQVKIFIRNMYTKPRLCARKVVRSALSRGLRSQWNKLLGTRLTTVCSWHSTSQKHF